MNKKIAQVNISTETNIIGLIIAILILVGLA